MRIHFFIHVVILISLLVMFFFKKISISTIPIDINLALQQYAIMFTLIILPSALKIYAIRLKKVKKSDIVSTIQSFKKTYYLRLYLVATAALLNIFLYGISRIQNFAWLAVISISMYAFCMPSVSDLAKLTGKDLDEETIPKNKYDEHE